MQHNKTFLIREKLPIYLLNSLKSENIFLFSCILSSFRLFVFFVFSFFRFFVFSFFRSVVFSFFHPFDRNSSVILFAFLRAVSLFVLYCMFRQVSIFRGSRCYFLPGISLYVYSYSCKCGTRLFT